MTGAVRPITRIECMCGSPRQYSYVCYKYNGTHVVGIERCNLHRIILHFTNLSAVLWAFNARDIDLTQIHAAVLIRCR